MRDPELLDILAVVFTSFIIPFMLFAFWEKLTHRVQGKPSTWKEAKQVFRGSLIFGGFLSGSYCSVALGSGVVGFLFFIALGAVLGFVLRDVLKEDEYQ